MDLQSLANLAENYARVQERVSSIQSVLSQDAEMSHICARGVEDASKLTALEGFVLLG